MAEDVTPGTPPPQPELPLVPDRRERARRSSYRLRFGIIYLLLAAVVGAGVGAFIVLASGPDEPEKPAWSAWQPNGSRVMKVRQIADRIPKSYRAENGSQLTVSLASALTVPTAEGVSVPVRAVVVRPDTSKGLAEEDDIAVYPAGNIVSFALCGTKSKEQCEVTPSSAGQDTLLRRQALELSLYTFKYVNSVNSVVVFMPPTAETQSTVFLRRNDVADELDQPLSSLLPTVKPRVGALSAFERKQILRLTQPRTYAAEVQASPDGSPVVILTPAGEATG